MLLFIAYKISDFQGFVYNSPEGYDKIFREKIILDATKNEYKKWVLWYFLLFVFFIVGISFFITDFSWLFIEKD